MTINSACRFLILFLLVLSSGSVYVNIFSGGFVYVTVLFLSLFSILINPKVKRENFNSLLVSLGVSIALLFLSWMFNDFDLTGLVYPKYIFRFVCICVAFFALVSSDKEGLSIKHLILPLKVIAIHAVLNFLVGFVFGDLRVAVPSDNLIIQTIGYVFFYISFYEIGGIIILRNNGFFWEPGVLSVLMNLLLFLLIYYTPKGNKTFKVIAVLMIVSTFSTTGLGVMCLIFAFDFLSTKLTLKKAFFFGLVVLIMTPVMIANVQEKVSGDSKVSFLSRNYDALIALDIVRNNPLKGIGPALDTYLAEQKKYPLFMTSIELDGARGNTNSILSAFISFGIPIGSVFLLMLFYQKIVTDRKRLFLICVILLASEPLIFTGVFMILMISSFYSAETFLTTEREG